MQCGTQCGGFQFLLILDLWGIRLHAVVVFGLGKNLLFKSVLGHCVKIPLSNSLWFTDEAQQLESQMALPYSQRHMPHMNQDVLHVNGGPQITSIWYDRYYETFFVTQICKKMLIFLFAQWIFNGKLICNTDQISRRVLGKVEE